MGKVVDLALISATDGELITYAVVACVHIEDALCSI